MQAVSGRRTTRLIFGAMAVLFLVVFYAYLPQTVSAHECAARQIATSGASAPVSGRRGQVGLPAASQASSQAGSKIRLSKAYTQLPMSFEANRGQAPDSVRFLARGQGYALFLTGDEAVLALQGSGARDRGPGPTEMSGTRVTKVRSQDSVLRMRLAGANPDATVVGGEALPGKSNYFIGNDPQKWQTNVPNYARVRYQSVYPGVDLVYYGNQGQLEYDFVVAPGADPGVIKMNVGAASEPPRAHRDAPLRIAANGDLLLEAGGGEVRFHKPVVYQPALLADSMLSAEREPVDGHYSINSSRQVSFKVAHYDRTRPLIIDPTLTYSTYLGGTGSDGASGIAVDTSGNVYITGTAASTNFPLSASPFQKANAGGTDVFVSKLNPQGTALVYSTYLGGSGNDIGAAIAVDSLGDAYVTGNTGSTNFPVTPGVKQPTLAGKTGDIDAFVTEINPDGSALLYSTYWGGKQQDYGTAIAVDTKGDAYFTGYTESIDFPATSTAFQAFNAGLTEAFFTELGPGGVKPVYSTYFGGSNVDMAASIALDPTFNAYIAGQTASLNLPVSSTAYQKANAGGLSDAFVAEFNPTLSGTASLLFATYLGGSGNDYGYGIALDSADNIYVTGSTTSSNFPVTTGVLQSALKGAQDVFVTKLLPLGASLSYSTYLGDTGSNSTACGGAPCTDAIAVDADGNALVTGNTIATDFPTPDALQSACSGGAAPALPCDDAFVASLNPDGTMLNYATYLGGSQHDAGAAIALDPQYAYIAGSTLSTDFPTTAGVFQPSCGSTASCGNAFVLKIEPVSLPGVQVSPVVLPFGVVPISTTSTVLANGSPAVTTVTNNSGASITFTTAPTATAPFAVSATGTTCKTALANGASCTVAVTFTPVTATVATGTLTLTDAGTQTVKLAGTGVDSVVSLSPASLAFGDQSLNTVSGAKTVTLTNSGSGSLTLSSIVVSGDGFAQTSNTCGTSVAAGSRCMIFITFTPATSGMVSGTLTVTDNATGSPQTVSLTGTGTSPGVSLSAASLNFGSQIVGTRSSTPQTVTVTNTGNATLSVTSISISGTNVMEFTLLSKSPCGASIPAGISCSIQINFKPLGDGSRSAVLTIGDNAPGGSQTVQLSGMGGDFQLSVSPGTTSVNPGSSASYTVNVTPVGGFNAAVTLGCVGAPTYGSCTLTPAAVTPNGSSAAQATLKVLTLSPAAAPPGSLRLPPGGLFKLPWLIALLGGMLGLAALARKRTRRGWMVLAATFVLASLWMSCTSGPPSGNPNNPANNGTPPGTYTLTITGASNGLGENTTVQIKVN